MIFRKSFLLLFLLSVTVLYTFEPRVYISTKGKKPFFYIETDQYKQFLNSVKTFYFSLRKGRERKYIILEWNTLTRLASGKFVFPIFKIDELRKMGVDVKGKFALLVFQGNQLKKTSYQFMVPVRDADLFFRSMKKSKKHFKEIKKGSLLKSKYAFVAKGKKHVVFSDEKRYALEGLKFARNDLIKRTDYRLIQKTFKKHSYQAARFFIFKEALKEWLLLKSFLSLPRYDPSSPEGQIDHHVHAAGGEFNIDQDHFALRGQLIINKKFLANNVLFSDLSFRPGNSPHPPPEFDKLRLDHFSGPVMAYISLLLDFENFSLSKNLPINTADLNFIENIKKYLNGNSSIIVSDYTSNSLSFDINSWEAYFSVGLKKNADIKDLQNILLKTFNTGKKKSMIKLIKTSLQGMPLWEIKYTRSHPRKLKKSKSIFMLFRPEEINILSKKPSAKFLVFKKKKTLLQSNKELLRIKKTENIFSFLFVDIALIYNKIRRSSFARAFSNYLSYLKNIQSIHAYFTKNKGNLEFNFKILLN